MIFMDVLYFIMYLNVLYLIKKIYELPIFIMYFVIGLIVFFLSSFLFKIIIIIVSFIYLLYLIMRG